MAKKKTKLEKMSKKERTSLAYALATNLAKHGKPQSPTNERKLTKGEEKKKEKHVMKFKKAFNLEEVQHIVQTIREQELKNPKKADLNKDGKLSSYEKKRGAAIEKAIQKESHTGNPNDKYVVRPCKNKKEPWAVWEGETRVKGFATKEEAQKFADKKNKEQGLNEGFLSKVAGGLAVIAGLVALGQINMNDPVIKDLKAQYELAETPAEKEEIQNQIEARLIYLDTGKEQVYEDLDVGHQDNEPKMLKADLYRIAKYAAELYKMIDQFDIEGQEVDFPQWWQAKIITSKEAMVKAKHYLDGELQVDKIDNMLNNAEV